MLEQPLTRDRLYPWAALARPSGCGINLTLDVADVSAMLHELVELGTTIYLPLEERRYDRSGDAVGVRQFAVQDPDGNLFRISQDLGVRVR